MNKNIRDLLADCRIELRTLMRDFHKSELCRRIDEARAELASDGTPAATTPLPAAAISTDRIAQAWRLAAEDLKITAPAIHQLLAKKVAQHLAASATNADANAPVIAADSPAAAPESVAPAETAAAEAAETASSVDGDAAAATTPEAAAVEPVVATAPSDPLAPSHDDLVAISRHKRRFSEAQREWCVGEALIRSGFTINPNDFIGGGDHAMALYLLESEPAPH
jgi:hypothetical protein